MTTATATRPHQAVCDQHSKYVAGCRPCQQRSADRSRLRYRHLAYGTWQGRIDAKPSTDHVLALIQLGWSARRIAAVSGVARSAVERLANGALEHVYAPTEAAILAIPLGPCRADHGGRVDATGVARRLQALTAIGHPVPTLAAELDASELSVRRWRRQHTARISARQWQAIHALYERLSHVPGFCDRARADARRHGWAPPLAWDDDTIDDPAATPALGGVAAVVDEVAIRRALSGERVPLTHDERREAVRAGRRAGMSLAALNAALHQSGSTTKALMAEIRDAEQAAA